MATEELRIKAVEFAGNWRKADCFSWYDKPQDAERWGLYHYATRDDTLLSESNAAAIEREFAHMAGRGNVRMEHFEHWACGWVDALAIRPLDKHGKVTAAFRRLCEIQERLSGYPVLDERDYSEREYRATFDNLKEIARRLGVRLTPDQTWEVYHWFALNNDNALENRDDRGAWPEDEEVKTALAALGIECSND